MLKLLGKVWKLLSPRTRTWISRSVQVKFTVSAGAVIVNQEGEVLLLNHVLRPVSGWGIPGGFLDRGEQPEAAVRREIREETGIELDDVSLFRVRTFQRHIEMIFTAHTTGTARVLSREISELAWFAREDVPEEMTFDQHRLIGEALDSMSLKQNLEDDRSAE